MIARSQAREDFAKKINGYKNISFLASDMSSRTYYRIATSDQSFVLMDTDDHEELSRFMRIQSVLIDMGINAPRALDHDLNSGFLLMEDFGDLTLTKALINNNSKENEYSLYQKSVNILHQIIERFEITKAELLPYDAETHVKEVTLFVDFYFPYIHNHPIDDHSKKDWQNLWVKALNEILPLAPNVLTLRDYHVDNILLQPNGSLGILDFQDALLGSIMYDYISLVEDARRPLNQDLYNEMTKLFLLPFDRQKHQDYLQNAAVVGACRHAKVLGIFTRYQKKYNNNSKLIHLNHVLNLLIRAIVRSDQNEILYFLKDNGFLKEGLHT